MKYEKANEKVQTIVSAILGPKLESSTVSATISVDSSRESVSRKVEKVSQNVDMDTMPICFGDFKKCSVPILNSRLIHKSGCAARTRSPRI